MTVLAASSSVAEGAAPPTPGGQSGSDLWILWLAFGAATILTFGSTVDDPFITLRYAHNVLNGLGPVFNPGQRVNGATSPIGLLVSILVLLLPGGFAMLKLKLVSLCFGALTVGWAKKLVDRFELPGFCRKAAIVLIGASPVIGFGSASGLETTIAAFATVGMVLELHSGRAFVRPRSAYVFAGLLVATRPEGIFLVIAAVLVAVTVEGPLRPWSRARWALPAAVTEAVILLANRVYYGTWLPNTYYAKHIPTAKALPGGVSYLLHGWELGYFWTSLGGRLLSVALIVASVGLMIAGLIVGLIRFRTLGYLAGVSLAQALFIVKSGGDWMQGSRFLLPIVPLLVILAVSAAARAWSTRGHSRPAAIALTAVFSAATLFPYVPAIYGHQGPAWTIRSFSDHGLVATGGYTYSKLWADSPALLSCVPNGQTVALTEVGYAGFARLDLGVLDLRGLTSRVIADTASPSSRFSYGVQDPGWASVSSPVGKAILAYRPTAILTLDGAGQAVLGGTYRLVASDYSLGITVSLYAAGWPVRRPDTVAKRGSARVAELN